MSASLVGSEMCIRDSPGCLPCGHWAPPRCHLALRGFQSHANWLVEWCGPVSYTHLTLPTICSV
eukprot:12175891-Alexandrium_andersonii.AAC.1